MPARASKSAGRPRQRRTSRRVSNRSASHGRELVLADGSPIRDKARRDYTKLQATLAKAQSELDHFHQHDRPAYQRWLHAEFGRLLTQQRELRAKIAHAQNLILMVQEEVMLTGCSYHRAYRRVQRELEAEEEATQTDHHQRHRTHSAHEQSGENDPSDCFNQFFSGQQPPPGFDPPPQRKPPPAPPKSRLRELYRALVRLLHPDRNKELTPQQKEAWHQARNAYEAGDEDQLELILTLCELEKREAGSRQTSVGMLLRIIEQLKRAVRAIRRELRECQQDPAWKFTRQKNHELLHHQTQRVLEEESFHMREVYQEMEGILKSWQHRRRPRDPDWYSPL